MPATVAPGSHLGGYVVERLLGSGGMGTVYLARDDSLERTVALKLLAPELVRDDDFRRRFLQESRVAASLEHPHICPVYGAGDADGILYLALRYVEGEDAARLVEREGPLPPERALILLTNLAAALDHAHAHALLHRDVKPENALLDADGNVYLTDFGLARPLEQGGAENTRALEGTLLYLSPEQIAGRAASPASDEYALACLAYVLLTGEPPFRRSHEASILYAHLRDEVPSLAELGLARLDPVFRQALAKQPEERYSSCTAFVASLAKAAAAREPAQATWPETLPRARTSFLGRERELDELEAIVSAGTRVLTLTGPGGTGKTRLGLELAARLASNYEGGATWVALAAIADPDLMPPQIAGALGRADVPLETAIAEGGARLLCLDNLEQLLPSVAVELATLVDRCPNLTLLCTSRSPLRIERETEYRVPPLDESEAVALFLERAAAHRVPAESREVGRAICRRLDCLPLAVELAAARLTLLSPEALLDRLDKRLPLLTAGPRDAPARQQTLAATIGWSYDLLAEPEQTLFARLEVFHGGFTLEAAEKVCGAELASIAGLADASLLRRRLSSASDARFDMLAVIHEYAAGKLSDPAEVYEVQERHCEFYAAWVERARIEAEEEQELWSALVREELPNVRAALAWAAEQGDPKRFAGIVWRLGRFWYQFGLGSESQMWAERALAAIGMEPTAERAGCLHVLGVGAWVRGDYPTAKQAYEESADLWRVVGDMKQLSRLLGNLGVIALEQKDFDEAVAYLDESADAARDAGDLREELSALGNLGAVHSRRGEQERAAEIYEQVATAAERIHDDGNRAFALSNLGISREELGQYEQAEAALAEALGLLDRLDWKEGLIYTLSGLARVAIARDEPRRATRLLRAADRLSESIGLAWQGDEVENRAGAEARLREMLGPEFETCWAEMALIPVQDVIAEESRQPLTTRS